jgi:uncharacterized protein
VSGQKHPAIGTLIGFDLTVDKAEAVKDFYATVVGWEVEPLDMGGYADYFMKSPETGDTVAGICHARGDNAGLPGQWLSYVVVPDLEASLALCAAQGGTVLTEIRDGCEARYCVIRDPAGAVLALMELHGGAEDA